MRKTIRNRLNGELVEQQGSRYDQNFEVGKLYADRGDFNLALPYLVEASKGYLSERQTLGFLEAETLMLRIFAEREEFEKIQNFKERLQDLVIKEGLELGSRTYYTLALCAGYKGQHESSFEYLQKSLSIALAKENKVDTAYALMGLAITYKNLGKITEALAELKNLELLAQPLNLSEISINAKFLTAQILNKNKQYDEALSVLWQAYEMVKFQKNMTLHIFVLYYLGCTYTFRGDLDKAQIHLKLAASAVDNNNSIRLAKAIQRALAECGSEHPQNYDLIVELATQSVQEKQLGRVDLKNQFILMDLLKLLAAHPGQVYSKENLVKNIWKQSYEPGVHDNKIYVTIKRLRKLIEPDFDKPKYIFRAKDGYFLNSSAKVFVESRGNH